jgi:hypothetical protein
LSHTTGVLVGMGLALTIATFSNHRDSPGPLEPVTPPPRS